MVPKTIITKIIEGGIMAPSAHNSQPWRFIVIMKKNKKYNFTKCLERLIYSAKFLTSIKILLKNCVDVIKSSPVVILVINDCSFSKKIKKFGKVYRDVAYISEIESISAAIENMHLIATSLGVGMVWMTMPLLLKKQVANFFNEKGDLVAILAFGYSAEQGKEMVRKPIAETTKFII